MTDYPRKFANTLFITLCKSDIYCIYKCNGIPCNCKKQKKSRFLIFLYYYFISAMFIPFNVLMLPLVNEANKFHIDNVLGITFFLYIVFGMPMNTFYIPVIKINSGSVG